MGELPDQASGEITVLDMEASIEHLTRGTVRNVDVLLVITEPYYRSLETAGRMVPLAQELGLERVWVVANKVRSERDEAAIREYCARHQFDVIGVLPFDESVTEADRQGRSLMDYAPTAAAVVAVQALADVVMQRTGTPPPARVSGGS
jgi:CO dehydrogenase maturation factor